MHYLESVEFSVLTQKGGASKQVADNWGFFRLPAAAGSSGDTQALTGAPDGFMVNRQSKQAALAVDFLKFMTNQDNAQKMTADLGWLSAVKGSATAQNSFPQLSERPRRHRQGEPVRDLAGHRHQRRRRRCLPLGGGGNHRRIPDAAAGDGLCAERCAEGEEAGRLSTGPLRRNGSAAVSRGPGTATEKGNQA